MAVQHRETHPGPACKSRDEGDPLSGDSQTEGTAGSAVDRPSCTRSSPRLLRSLKEKGNFLRTQFSQLHKNITGLRFGRQRKDSRSSQRAPECGDDVTEDVQEGDRIPSEQESEDTSERVCAVCAREGVTSGGCVHQVVPGRYGRIVSSVVGGVVAVDTAAAGKSSADDGSGVDDCHCCTAGGDHANMTVRGGECMEDSQTPPAASHTAAACNGHPPSHPPPPPHHHRHHEHLDHRHNHSHHPRRQERDHDRGPGPGHRHSSISSGSRGFQSISEVSEPDGAFSLREDPRPAETDDELPLGSEANSLRQDTDRHGNGVVVQLPVDKRLLWLRQGGGLLPHSGWSSFNSDASNLTSGSSANSVDWLLQERQVDPEVVLRNLGFGGGHIQSTSGMYNRIPVRFFPQEAAPPDEAEGGAQEWGAEGGRRNPSRAAAAWTRARTMSSAMFNLKVLSSLQQASPLGMLGAGSLHGPSPLSGSSSSVTPPGNPRSVLHPDNQRALARQGFYGDNLPEGVDPDIVHGAQRGNDEDDVPTRRSAEDRRKMYHKTRSKRQRSLVESNGDESGPAETISRDSVMKSVDFSTTTESTDSGELLSSAPTTPGDVFTDRATSPLPGAPANIEDLYFPGRDEIHSKFSDSRKKLTEKLMADLDNDDNYFVSPPGSRQPTVEKAATLTEAQEQNLEEEVDEMELPAARAASVKSDLSTKSVTIVVSGNSGARKASPINLPGVGGMNFLSIVNAAVDRLSDSGSEHTLVEHQSSTSGSESPRPSQTGSNGEQKQNQGGDESHCDGFADVEEGPVLYHGRRRGQGSPRDENDNFTEARQAQGEKLRHHRVKSQFLDDELPRMSSIQSDSSGFGDAEVSGDNAPQEMAFLKVNSLGSSCESSTTQGSTSTVTHVNNIPGQQRDSSTHSSPFYLHAEFDDNQQVQSRVTHKQGSGPSPTDPGSGRRFVSWCYIPVSNRSTQPNSTSPRKQSTRAATSPKDFVLGKTRISLVLQEKDPQQMDSSGRRDVRREGAELDSNERPLSEELALAGLRGELQSSTPRYPAGQVPVTSVPRLMLQRPTMDTGSPDGTRSSGDELDDERSSPYSPWGRDMASGGAGARHRFTPSAGDEGDFGSGASVEESSVYSCASTTDSITSGSSSEILDCHKLIKLINQPTMFKGRKTRVVHYRPKRHLREWPSLVKKKKLQEETRLAQYAVQKFKTELSIMETAVMVKYQMAFEDLSQEEREDVEELQHLWSEVRRQVMETEHLLTSRMKAIASGNDCFNSLASISVLQRMIDILKEQMFQSQISCSQEEREEEEEEEGERWVGEGRAYPYPVYSPRYSSSSWGELPRSPAVRGHYSSSFSHLPMSPAYPDRTFEQLRRSLMSDVRQELGTSLQSLQDDLQRRDEEIQRLQQQLMEQRTRGSRPSSSRSRSYQSPRQRNVNRKETDV